MKKRECNIGGHKHSKAEDRKEERSKQQQGGWPQASVKKGAAGVSEKSEKTTGFHMFYNERLVCGGLTSSDDFGSKSCGFRV